jgi:rod shape-determining protein MreC
VKKFVGQTMHVAAPVRAWAQRFAFLFLIVAAFALMLLGKADTVLVERARTMVTDAMAPVLELLSRPVDTVGDFVEQVQELADLRADNAELKRENERLRNWQVVAQRLEVENAALRDVTRLSAEPGMRFVTARVIGDPGGAFARSVLVNAGARDGLAKSQAAITSDGLAGRVAEVGQRSARVLLLTDINSRVPVVVGTARDRAILTGDNTSQPRLQFMAPDTEISPGDRVVTSGRGGVFPPGLPVGVVIQADESALRVQPYVDWAHMEYVRLVDYEFSDMLLAAGVESPEAAAQEVASQEEITQETTTQEAVGHQETATQEPAGHPEPAGQGEPQ